MIDDRNKTEITKHVTRAAIQYLSLRGFKPVETEVAVADGWVADVASFIDPTETELVELKLVPRKPRYHYGDSAAVTEKIHRRDAEWQALKDKVFRLMTAVVEVKTSRSDFTRDYDRKFKKPAAADLCYIAMQNDLYRSICGMWYPPGWGVLVYHPGKDCVNLERVPAPFTMSPQQQRDVIAQVAIRRHHLTHEQHTRELNKEIRDMHNERCSVTRMSAAIQLVSDVVQGKYGSATGAIEWHGREIKHITQRQKQELEELFGQASRTTPAGEESAKEQRPVFGGSVAAMES